MNRIYSALSNIKFLRNSYTSKFLFIAFLGIHIPLLGLIGLIILHSQNIPPLYVFVTALIFTLLATAITLYILNSLLYPLKQSKKTLEDFLSNRTLPALPLNYTDEAGILMQNIYLALTELERRIEEKKDLTRFISHDLRLPLLNLKIFSSELADSETMNPEKSKKLASMIAKCANEQEVLLEKVIEILDYDSLDILSDHLQITHINPLIESSIDSVQNTAGKKNIGIVFNPAKSYSVKVSPALFTQVIKNILTNSIKFSHPGSAVRVNIIQQTNSIDIIITDDGVGFDPSHSERIFERLTKGQPGTAGEPSTGVGLYLSRKIIDGHKGTLTAKSEGIGKGATFLVSIPKN